MVTLNANTVETPEKHSESDDRNRHKSTIAKLTSVIPSSGFISDPSKGAKSQTNTPYIGKLGTVDFQELSPLPLNTSFGLDDRPLPNKALNCKKQTAVKRQSTHKSQSWETKSNSNAVQSLTPKQADRARKIKNDTGPHPRVLQNTLCQNGLKCRAADSEV
jgi:hypothetical protein